MNSKVYLRVQDEEDPRGNPLYREVDWNRDIHKGEWVPVGENTSDESRMTRVEEVYHYLDEDPPCTVVDVWVTREHYERLLQEGGWTEGP